MAILDTPILIMGRLPIYTLIIGVEVSGQQSLDMTVHHDIKELSDSAN